VATHPPPRKTPWRDLQWPRIPHLGEMAQVLTLATVTLLLLYLVATPSSALTTCPGFPGYCSEAFPGSFCNVVCSRGRNNVPLCQEDGTWTDIPRCIEHDPGVEEQVPGLCPGIPGYCAVGFINTQCKFDCYTGPDIDSICTADGTWAPYPTCEGDLRETQDGCDGCPGPLGDTRNRTAEAIIASNTVSDRRVPKIVGDSEGRKIVPSFAGNINIGPVETKPAEQENQIFSPTPKTTTYRSPPASVKRKPIVSTFRQPGGGSLLASDRQPDSKQPVQPRQPDSRQPVQPRQPDSRQPVQPRQPDSRQPVQPRQPEAIVTAAPPAGPTLSLFDRIKARARGSSTTPTQSPRERAPSLFAEPSRDPSPPSRARPVINPAPYQANSRFGVFDEVQLAVPGQQQLPNRGQAFPAVPRGSSSSGQAQPYGQPQPYGEFQTVSLQG